METGRDASTWLTDWRHVCERCGETMVEQQCKILCPRCGYSRDCSDP